MRFPSATDHEEIVAVAQTILQECVQNRVPVLSFRRKFSTPVVLEEPHVEQIADVPVHRILELSGSRAEHSFGVGSSLHRGADCGQCHRSCGKRRGNSACAYRRGADCDHDSATDHGENQGGDSILVDFTLFLCFWALVSDTGAAGARITRTTGNSHGVTSQSRASLPPLQVTTCATRRRRSLVHPQTIGCTSTKRITVATREFQSPMLTTRRRASTVC